MQEKIIQINYWKESRKELNKIIGEMNGLVLLTHNSVEFPGIVDFLNIIKKNEQTILLYISLINSYRHIKQSLETAPLIKKKLVVVDCASGFVEIPDTIDCAYRQPPSNLEELKNLIMTNIHRVNPNMVVIDSLTQFINFTMPKDQEVHELYKFLRSIKGNAIGITCDTIILTYDDRMGSMKRLPTLFTDMILKLEVIREKVEWKD